MPRQTSQKRELLANTLNKVLLGVFAVVLGLVVLGSLRMQTAHAVTDSNLNFQARLQTAAGAIVPDGNYNIEFKLYSASSGGTTLWTEDYLNSASQGVRVANGFVSVNLGSVTAFPTTINWDQQLWLTMNIGGTTTGAPSYDGEMSPRLPLTAVPYAFKAGQLAQSNSGGTLFSTLSLQAPTIGNQNFVIQDQGAAGTYNILTAPSGSDGYVKLQGSTPGTQQSGNLNISGTAIAGTLQGTAINATSTLSVNGTNLSVASSGDITFGNNANHTISIAAAATNTDGAKLTIQAGNGTGTNQNGGDLVLQGGAKVGTGNAGAVVIKAQTDGTGVFKVQNAAGNSIFAVDTTNNKIGTIDTTAASTNSRDLKITSGNAGGTTSNSGNVFLDAGSATGTAGTLYLGQGTTSTGNSSAVIIGRSSITTTLQGAVAIPGATALSLGTSSSATGGIIFKGSGGTGTLTVQGPSTPNAGNFTLSIPAITANANVCTDNSICSGYASAASLAGYVQLQGASPVAQSGNISIAGTALFQPSTDSTSAFDIKTSAANNIFTVDTLNGRVGIGLGSSNTPTLQGGGLEINGALRLSGGGVSGTTDYYVTPLGTNLTTKINIPNYDPGSFNQIIAFGLARCTNPTETSPTCAVSGYAASTARAITIADARIAGHQPTISILSPDETNIFGLSYDGTTGSGATGYLLSTNNNLALRANGRTQLTATYTGTNTGSVTIGDPTNVQGSLVFANNTNNAGVIITSGITSSQYTIQLPTAIGSAGQCVYIASVASTTQTLGYTTCASGGVATVGTLDGGTANATGATISGTTIYLQSASSSFAGAVNTTTQTFAGLKTFNGGITLGASAGSGTVLTNNGATLNATLAVTDRNGTNGLWLSGTTSNPATTVDIYTAFSIAQTTASQTVTIPTPTASTTYGRIIYITNVGTASFTLLGATINPGATATLIWSNTNGAASWSFAGADKASILNQTTQQTGASLNIDGSGTFGTAVSTVQLTATGQSILGGGSNQQQVIIKANSSQSATTPLLVLKDSSNGELTRFTADNYSDLFIGNAAGSAVTGGTNRNTFVGSSSGSSVTNGTNNTALGYQSLLSTTSNGNNTAIGTNALQNSNAVFNTALGSSAGSSITTGYENTAIGGTSLNSVTTGFRNTAIGSSAGYLDSGGSFATLNSIQNSTAVGAYAQVQTNNSIVLGSVDLGTKVGIGTTIPGNIFSVSPVYYATGTAAVTSTAPNTGTGGTTVTGTGTIWTSAMVGMQFIFANGQSATVNSFTDATHLVLSASQPITTAQAYRIHTGGFQVTSAGNAYIQNTSTTAFQVQNSAGTAMFTVDTVNNKIITSATEQANSGITIGSSGGNGILTNNGATVNTVLVVGNLATGGAIGTASTTVDAYTAASIAQTTASQTITIPSPTASTTYGRFFYVTNVGTASFVMLGATINPGATASLVWSNTNGGASWTFAGTDKASILNQTTQQTGASFNIDGTGVIGTSLTTPLVQATANLTLQTNSSSASIIAKTATNSVNGFQIQNATNVALFSLDTTTGNITLGASGNTVTFTAGGGLSAAGTAQHTKTIALMPEYAGAVLDATGDASCSSANNGTMTSGFDSTNVVSYYKWASNATAQCYDIVVRVPIPSDWSAWASTTPITVNSYTTNTSTGLINLEMRNTSGTVETSCNYVNITPSSTSTWSTANSSNCVLASTTTGYSANGTMTLRLRMTGGTASDVRLNGITLTYKSSF